MNFYFKLIIKFFLLQFSFKSKKSIWRNLLKNFNHFRSINPNKKISIFLFYFQFSYKFWKSILKNSFSVKRAQNKTFQFPSTGKSFSTPTPRMCERKINPEKSEKCARASEIIAKREISLSPVRGCFTVQRAWGKFFSFLFQTQTHWNVFISTSLKWNSFFFFCFPLRRSQ